MAAARRDIGPALQKFRDFLLGRRHTVGLRFEDGLADRTQPPPNLPDGPAHKLAQNFYYSRDARREVDPPIDVGSQKLLGTAKDAATASKLPTPGKVWKWD